jgi:prephenate dehydrogenase
MNDRARKKLGLIGLGAFGGLAAEHLRHHFDVVAADAADRRADAEALGIGWGSIEEAAACPYVLLAVPVQSFAALLERIRAHVQPGSLIVDVASVKLATVTPMREILPESVEIVGTHPMFGPQSAADGLAGHRIVVCPVRTERLDAVRAFLEKRLALDVYICDAETHDREIAQTQALAQFVGRALARLEESKSPVRTPGYDRFRVVAETVGDDSWELFVAIQNLNPFAAEMRAELLGHLRELQKRLAAEAGAGRGDGGSTDAEAGAAPGGGGSTDAAPARRVSADGVVAANTEAPAERDD